MFVITVKMDVVEIFKNLRDRLVSSEFASQQRIRAEDLRADYGVSASTIREVMFRLSTHGLLDFQEQRGFRKPELSPELQNELTYFRILLECEGAVLSVRNGDIAWEARLSAAHYALSHIEKRAKDHEPSTELLLLWTHAELDFHQTLIDACRNEILKQTHETVFFRHRQQMNTEDRDFHKVSQNIHHHKQIVDAALEKNEELVRKYVKHHLVQNLATVELAQ
ncbi:GntR family transcriptional regulator [uncultured Cohaesibacter sp.]|uniref:GntR family transcriptional regulator n=1 Tax=uncultured Cohaesibacter sp. TaxID=1002546 RepID=UPI0029C8F933|nr:GntR family transcriptional regulator [uncultured Cohaesibacter sp.]